MKKMTTLLVAVTSMATSVIASVTITPSSRTFAKEGRGNSILTSGSETRTATTDVSWTSTLGRPRLMSLSPHWAYKSLKKKSRGGAVLLRNKAAEADTGYEREEKTGESNSDGMRQLSGMLCWRRSGVDAFVILAEIAKPRSFGEAITPPSCRSGVSSHHDGGFATVSLQMNVGCCDRLRIVI